MAEAGSVSFEDQAGLEREFQDCGSYTLKPWDGRGARGKKQNNSCCVVKAGLWQVPGVPDCRDWQDTKGVGEARAQKEKHAPHPGIYFTFPV